VKRLPCPGELWIRRWRLRGPAVLDAETTETGLRGPGRSTSAGSNPTPSSSTSIWSIPAPSLRMRSFAVRVPVVLDDVKEQLSNALEHQDLHLLARRLSRFFRSSATSRPCFSFIHRASHCNARARPAL